MYETSNDLAPTTRRPAIEMLNEHLADAIDLHLQAKQAHWNIKGPNFIAIHEMLDGFRSELDTYVDTIAERAVQLGGIAMGTSQVVAEKSTLGAYPTNISSSRDHLAALIDRYAATAKLVRTAIDETDEAGDAGTADIFTGYSRALDKALWFLESHTQATE